MAGGGAGPGHGQVPPAPDGVPPPPPPPAPPTPRASASLAGATDTRIEDIDQRSKIIERKLELLDEQAAQRKASEVVVSAGDRGFSFKSADGAFVIKLRGLLQADGREFVKDDVLALRSTFLIRKARPSWKRPCGTGSISG